jgi:hypothetical protein
MARYQAYQAQLADHAIGTTFTQAEAFLKAAADTRTLTDTTTVHAPR